MTYMFTMRPVDPPGDAPLLHRWLTHPKSAFWLMRDATQAEVRRYFADRDAVLGLHEEDPVFLFERYDPAHELAGVYPVEPGDVGMHFLVAPTGRPLHGFTRAVITTIMARLFADPATRRVVVEPDIRNTAVHALNAYVGFRVVDTVELAHKRALLSVCTRGDFEGAAAWTT